MPTRERSFARLVLASPTEIPPTRIVPSWKGSSAFTVLIRVDLPEPDGPQTTTTSPFFTEVVQRVKTRKEPYHFETFWISIIFSSPPLLDDCGALLQPLHK